MGARGFWLRGRLRPELPSRVLYLVFVVVAVVLTWRWLEFALPRYLPKDWAHAHEFDGLVDWKAARLYLAGRSPYAADSLAELRVIGFGHPPTTAFWFIPLAKLEKAIASELIGLSTWLFLLVQVYLCAREVKFPAPIALTALIFAWFVNTDGLVMHWGAVQLSQQIALPLTISWLYLRRGRQLPGGLALGVAATIKLFPGVLMLFTLVSGRWRAFLASAGLFIAVGAVMTATYGIECWPMFLKQQKLISQDWIGHIRNGSLQGVVMRLFSPTCVGQEGPSFKATLVGSGAGLFLFGVATWVSWRALRRVRAGDPTAIDLPFSLFSVLAVFLNPWIWEHYHVLLIQPAFVVGAMLWRSFRDVLNAWLDERTSHAALAREALVFSLGAFTLYFAIRIFAWEISTKVRMLELWHAHKSDWYHRQLHIHEVLNWLPWALMLLLSMFCVWYFERRRPGSVSSRTRAPVSGLVERAREPEAIAGHVG